MLFALTITPNFVAFKWSTESMWHATISMYKTNAVQAVDRALAEIQVRIHLPIIRPRHRVSDDQLEDMAVESEF